MAQKWHRNGIKLTFFGSFITASSLFAQSFSEIYLKTPIDEYYTKNHTVNFKIQDGELNGIKLDNQEVSIDEIDLIQDELNFVHKIQDDVAKQELENSSTEIIKFLNENNISYIDNGLNIRINSETLPSNLISFLETQEIVNFFEENISLKPSSAEYIHFALDDRMISTYGWVNSPKYYFKGVSSWLGSGKLLTGYTQDDILPNSNAKKVGVLFIDSPVEKSINPIPTCPTETKYTKTVIEEDFAPGYHDGYKHSNQLAFVINQSNYYYATLYCEAKSRFLRNINNLQNKYNIGMSVHGYSNNSYTSYSSTDEYVDLLAYNYGVIPFVTTGNGEYIQSPGFAMNAITVGEQDRSLKNNHSISKPEFKEVGELKVYDDFKNEYVTTSKGSSNSMAFVAGGFGVNLLSSMPFLKGYPALFKAFLLTLRDESSKTLNYSKVLNADLYHISQSHGSGGAEKAFGQYGLLSLKRNLVKGKKYKVAISWLVNPSSARTSLDSKKFNIDIDLYARYKDGSRNRYFTGSFSRTNNYEVIEFEAKKTALHTFYFRLNRPHKDKLELGIVFNELD